ncbi:MAG: hypothetical protein WC145_13110 [Aliarcobacter sp.]
MAQANLEKRCEYLHEMELTEDQRQLILGGLLGDMSILYPNKRSRYPRIVVSQGSAQAEYTEWKYAIMKNLVGTPPKTVVNQGYRPGNTVHRFQTRSLPCLVPMYDLVKPGGGKKTVVTRRWLDEIDSPMALAVWYLDDGSLTKNVNRPAQRVYGHSVQISAGYAETGKANLMAEWLDRVWGIPTRIHSGVRGAKGKPDSTVWISKSSDVDAFLDIVRPYAVPCMHYKVIRDYTYTT